MFLRVSYADIHGTKYVKKNIVICYTSEHDQSPVFGKITDLIVTCETVCLLILVPYVPVKFNKHFNAYEVQEIEDEYLVCQQSDLADYRPLTLSKSFDDGLDEEFVCLKYHVE